MTDRVLMVTGGSRGIGAACVIGAAKAGYGRIALNYTRDAAAAEATAAAARALGAEVAIIQADVGVPEDITRLFAETDARFGPLTHLVNNAGITGRTGAFADADPAEIARVIDLNVTGALLVAQEAVKRMSTARGGGGGAIINISSMAATLGSAGEYVWYAASKGAIDSFTLGLARELAREGIRVNAVAPGLIATDIHDASGAVGRLERLAPSIPLARPGTADEVAQAVLFLLSEAASYTTGAVLKVSGGR
ncbi:SDR family oxidoreductase [Xanthobacter dioxanivorans]|uniref:SDR family oxidoreductase n=1 Tax=Xanthobacter dioxanivorans TaxID=2528964 RepID=A0A974PKX7_9HYPH|nr:SDR family oxidoreductase [Xanthobacter dioxanivorans]QRG05238.1 SDR family oxidoreductase [Xanthobacter dioxanivorans]